MKKKYKKFLTEYLNKYEKYYIYCQKGIQSRKRNSKWYCGNYYNAIRYV